MDAFISFQQSVRLMFVILQDFEKCLGLNSFVYLLLLFWFVVGDIKIHSLFLWIFIVYDTIKLLFQPPSLTTNSTSKHEIWYNEGWNCVLQIYVKMSDYYSCFSLVCLLMLLYILLCSQKSTHRDKWMDTAVVTALAFRHCTWCCDF